MRFSGTTYSQALDHDRLSTQYNRVFNVMCDGQWHTIPELTSLSEVLTIPLNCFSS
jgi:hypothetical protein